MTRSLLAKASIAALAIVAASSASAFTGTFPSDSSTVIGSYPTVDANTIGYFWSASRGDSVRETFSTGLGSVTHLGLKLVIADNVLGSGAQVDWDVRVNGNTVGTWTVTQADGTGPVSLDYNFGAISDGGGMYEVGLFVTNQVPDGLGSIALGKNVRTSATLDAVPEPASMSILGLGALALLRKRK